MSVSVPTPLPVETSSVVTKLQDRRDIANAYFVQFDVENVQHGTLMNSANEMPYYCFCVSSYYIVCLVFVGKCYTRPLTTTALQPLAPPLVSLNSACRYETDSPVAVGIRPRRPQCLREPNFLHIATSLLPSSSFSICFSLALFPVGNSPLDAAPAFAMPCWSMSCS